MHLAAWPSVLSCLVRLISLVHLVYLSCLIFPSRYFVSKDLVDDLTYMCTSAISVIGAGRREKCNKCNLFLFLRLFFFFLFLFLSLLLFCSFVGSSWVELGFCKKRQASLKLHSIYLSADTVSQSASQPVTYSMCRSSVPFHSTVYSPVPIRFVSTCEREFSTLSVSVQAAA